MSTKKGDKEPTEKLDISGATVKATNKDISGNEEHEEEHEEEKNEEEHFTKTVKQSDVKEDINEEHEIDFLNEEHVNNFTSSKTKESQNKKEENPWKGKSMEEAQSEISKAEEEASKIDPETFYDIAEFIIFLIDASLSAAFKWWAKDTSDSAYSLSATKQKKLTKQLAAILIKYQAKFSIEFMFLISIVILYMPAFWVAHSKRKENKKQVPKPIPYIPPVINNPVHNMEIIKESKPKKQKTDKIEEEEILNEEISNQNEVIENKDENLEVVKPKRKRRAGQPAKIS